MNDSQNRNGICTSLVNITPSGFSLLLFLHLVALFLFLDWREVLDNPPVADTDYATHWAEVWSVSHYLEDGHLWGYDPYFMAGHPEGTLFDIDNKFIEVAAFALSRLGLPLPLSYNLALVSLMALAPLAIYPTSRLLGLGRGDALLAQLAALGLWYLDPAFRWSWQGSTLAFASAVCLSLLVLASAINLTHPERSPAPSAWLLWFVLGPLLFWLHALTFFLLLLPLILLTLHRWHVLSGVRRMILIVWPVIVLLANAPWLLAASRFFWARTASGHFLQGGLPALGADLFGIGRVDGASTVSLLGLRWLVLLLGGLGLWRMARRGPGGQAPAIGACGAFLVAYGAVYLPDGGNLQPYRYVEQAAMWSALGVGPGLRVLTDIYATRMPQRVRVGVVTILAFFAILWVGNAAWRFRPPPIGGPAHHRWQGPSPTVIEICEHLKEMPLERGRLLTDDARLGALLPWCSGAQVIGGHFFEIWTQYGYANATISDFLDVPYEDYTVTTWQESLEIYNVHWIIAHEEWAISGWYTLADWLADHPHQVIAGPRFGPYRFYQVRDAADELPFTIRAEHGRLLITDAPAQSFTLPFHWIPYLRTAPPSVRLSPETIGDDPIPFIRVEPAGNATIEICTDYPSLLPIYDSRTSCP